MKTKAIIIWNEENIVFLYVMKKTGWSGWEKRQHLLSIHIFLSSFEFWVSRKAIISGNNLFGKGLQRVGKWIMILTSSCEWSDCRSYCKYSQERHSVILLTYFLEIFLIPPGKVSQCFHQVINWIVAWSLLQILVIGNNLRKGNHQDIPYIYQTQIQN